MKITSLQVAVGLWMERCFGRVIAADKVERNFRFLEEALELVQAGGCSREDAHALVEYVFNRPVGELAQEVGGVSVTLAALCGAHNISWETAAGDEFRRINTSEMMDKIRRKQASKPQRGPLPGAYKAEEKVPEMGLVGILNSDLRRGGAAQVIIAASQTLVDSSVRRLYERDCPEYCHPDGLVGQWNELDFDKKKDHDGL